MTEQIKRQIVRLGLVLCALSILDSAALAQDSIGNMIDSKTGSVLFFNRYISNQAGGVLGDTQINITNTNLDESVSVQLFFVDGNSGSIPYFVLMLAPNQTVKFLTSEFDPGIQGYIVAVATDGFRATQFNSLIGSAHIRENDGRVVVLPAYSVAKRSPGPIEPKADGTYSLLFDGEVYERLPNAVAVYGINSDVADSNNLVVYSPTNNLIFGSSAVTNVLTIIDYPAKNLSNSFTVRGYRMDSFRSLFNRGSLRHAPTGGIPWIRMSSSTPILGSIITKGPGFSGGYNLQPLSFAPSYEIAIPVF
jgi:hypothetical protein